MTRHHHRHRRRERRDDLDDLDLDGPTSVIRILRIGWRPALAWCFVFGWTLTLLVTLFMLLSNMTTMSDASGLLIMLVGGGAAPTTMFTYGRSREKIEGVADADGLPPMPNDQQWRGLGDDLP